MNTNRSDIIEVEIYGNSFPIKKPQDDDEIDYIRELAAHVNKMMSQVHQKTGVFSTANIAIMAALNIAKEMFDERRRYTKTIQELIEALEEVIAEPTKGKRQEKENYELYFEEE